MTLPKWNEKFLIATAALEDAPVSTEAMEVYEEFFYTKALNFKTPAKRKRAMDDDESPVLSLLDVSVYSPFFKNNEDDEGVPITNLSQVRGVLASLDQGINSNNDALLNFVSEYRQEHGKAGGAICSLHLRLEALSATLGKVPTHLAFDYVAPSAWASIGAMAEKLDEVEKTLAIQDHWLVSHKEDVKQLVERQVKSNQESGHRKLDSFKQAFISATRGLGGRLDNVELTLIRIPANSQVRGGQHTSRELANPEPEVALTTKHFACREINYQPKETPHVGDETLEELSA